MLRRVKQTGCVYPPGWTEPSSFTISGANDSAPSGIPGLPNGTDVNGEYTKTNYVCPSTSDPFCGESKSCTYKPVYQKGGSDGLWLYTDATDSWQVGTSGNSVDCAGSAGGLLVWSKGYCPASPDDCNTEANWVRFFSPSAWDVDNMRIVASNN